MKPNISFFIALPLLFIIINLSSHVFAQDSTARLDSKLTRYMGNRCPKDAVFAKMQIGDDGSFLGYTESVDKNPFATGTYSIKGNSIYVAASINSTNPADVEQVAISYVFTNYSFLKDGKLQFNMSDRKGTFIYTKSK